MPFFSGADLLIFDAQYALAELVKRDWGHSSNMVGVELAELAGVKHLVLFHTDPNLDDDRIEDIEENTFAYSRIYNKEFPLTVSIADDGMEVQL